MTKRFAVHELSVHKVYKGTITLADLRKKFNIPEHAKVTCPMPIALMTPDPEVIVEALTVTWEEGK
mgnify:CR=1 FL=1